MRSWAFVGGLAFSLILQGAIPAYAQIAVGNKVTSPVQFGDRNIPLLPGEWTVISATDDGRSSKNRQTAKAFLAQLKGGQLDRWVSIDTNLQLNDGGGWARDKEICDRTDVHAGFSDSNNSRKDMACWSLNQRGETLGSKPGQTAIDFYRWSDTLGRPNTSLTLAYYFSKNGDYLRVVYHFNPVLAGFPDTPTAVWRGSPWHVDIAAKDSKKLEYLRSLKAIGDEQFAALQDVLR